MRVRYPPLPLSSGTPNPRTTSTPRFPRFTLPLMSTTQSPLTASPGLFFPPESVPIHPTRESWLEAFVALIRPHFAALGYTLPEGIRVSIGFPSKGGLGRDSYIQGECWDWQLSKDGCFEIFINPRISDPLEVLAVTIHELGHAAVGVAERHSPVFKRFSKTLGLTGKITEPEAGPELAHFLAAKLDTLGPYPGAAFDPFSQAPDQDDAPKSRMLKVECPDPQCGYIVRTTRKCLAKGTPTCPCGKVMIGPDDDIQRDTQK